MSSKVKGRESIRIKDSDTKKILDAATRSRRDRQAVERLEMDNFQQDPHFGIVLNKKAPKFLNSKKNNRDNSKKKNYDYYNRKYQRTFEQLIKMDQHVKPDSPNYSSIEACPSTLPRRVFCSVCGFQSKYTCPICGARYCSVTCFDKHKETRCLKWAA